MVRYVWGQGEESGARKGGQRTSGQDAGLGGMWNTVPTARSEGSWIM